MIKKTTVKDKKWHILIANGVNLDLLGKREPDVYGKESLQSIEDKVRKLSHQLQDIGWGTIDLDFFQSNSESQFLDKISAGWDGAIINAGAWTHTSLALADRLAALRMIFIEVHLSNIFKRETFRHHSYIAPLAAGSVSGLGSHSYLSALIGLVANLNEKK